MESRKNGFILGWCFLVLTIMVNTATAQDSGKIPAGPFDIIPSLNLVYEENDNFFQSPSDPTDVTTTITSPSLSLVTDNGVTRFDLNYRIDDGKRSGVTDNFDYSDQRLGAEFDWKANVRNQFRFGWNLSKGHNDPSADSLGEQNEFDDTDLSFRYIYGADGAKGRIILDIVDSDLEYTNNRNETAELDSQQTTTNLSFRMGMGGASRLVLQLISDVVEFENAPNRARDREDISYLLGFVWGLNDKVESGVLLGQTTNKLTDRNVESTESTWRVNLTWSPRDYTSFGLETSQFAESDEDGVGDFNTVSSWRASWSYDWNSSLRSTLSYTISEEDFIGLGGSFRVDDNDAVSLGITYTIRRWLSAELTYTSTERSSTDIDNNFERDSARLSLIMGL